MIIIIEKIQRLRILIDDRSHLVFLDLCHMGNDPGLQLDCLSKSVKPLAIFCIPFDHIVIKYACSPLSECNASL